MRFAWLIGSLEREGLNEMRCLRFKASVCGSCILPEVDASQGGGGQAHESDSACADGGPVSGQQAVEGRVRDLAVHDPALTQQAFLNETEFHQTCG